MYRRSSPLASQQSTTRGEYTLRNYETEFNERIALIQAILSSSGAEGIVYGNSGGKDSALVGILCKAACENTVGILMPCQSKRNYQEDTADALTVARQFHIESRILDLSSVKDSLVRQVSQITHLTPAALANMAPRLRMTSLYAVAASENRLVAGTGNRSEAYVGYFTKWGDGAYDFNPISDLTVTEIYEFLRWLKAPACIIEKAPSAALFEGQTDEAELGFTYAELDAFLLTGKPQGAAQVKIDAMHKNSGHKRIIRQNEPPKSI